MGVEREGTGLRLSSQGNSVSTNSQPNDHATLGFVNVGTAVASAVVNIWAGQNSTTGTLIAKIDASSTSGRAFEYMIRCHGGFWANMQGGNADVTITYF